MIAAAHSMAATVIPILLLVLFAAGMIIDSVRRAHIKQQRVSELRSLAAQLDFEDFNPDRDEDFSTGWGFLSRLAQGQERYAYNILRGIYHEQSLFIFDYHYQTGAGKNKKEHYCTFLMLVCKECFPRMTIGPESFGAKIAAALGIENDIKFESAEFSRLFCVRSPDKKFAYDVCNPQMIEYLLANHGLQFEIQGPVIMLPFEPQLPVEQVEFNLRRLIEVWSRLPQYLFTNA